MEKLTTILILLSLFGYITSLTGLVIVCYLTLDSRRAVDSKPASAYSSTKVMGSKKLKPRAKSEAELFTDEQNGK